MSVQGGPVLNVNNSPIHSQLKNKLTYIMSFSSKVLPKENAVLKFKKYYCSQFS